MVKGPEIQSRKQEAAIMLPALVFSRVDMSCRPMTELPKLDNPMQSILLAGRPLGYCNGKGYEAGLLPVFADSWHREEKL